MLQSNVDTPGINAEGGELIAGIQREHWGSEKEKGAQQRIYVEWVG